MTEWQEQMWGFFLDDNKEFAYCNTCLDCDRDCKQSFRVIGIYCPYYEALKKERAKERRKKRI
jgi:hypothetical protein